MSAAELGERRIIELLIKQYGIAQDMVIPFGDDVAAFPIDYDLLAILKTDVLVAKTDIPPSMTLTQAARKAVVMTVSDFAAKGVKPLALLTALTLPRDLFQKDIEDIGEGLRIGSKEYNVNIVGGDTGEGFDLTICCMLFGVAKKNDLMLRSGANVGDILAVTGFFGKPSAGLKMLLNDLNAPNNVKTKLIESVTLPKARLKEGLALADVKSVTASIDSSDGLAVSLHELAKSSNVGFELTNLPIAPESIEFANLYGLDPKELALYGGEEYELVLTCKPERFKNTIKIVEEEGGQLIPIGTTVEGHNIVLNHKGLKERIDYRGWEHFKD